MIIRTSKEEEKENQISNLTDLILVEATIECTNYKECESIDGADDAECLAVEAYANGWRVINDEVFCRKCVRNLKAKKK